MQQSRALQLLAKQDRQGRYVFTSQDLGKLFPEDSGGTLRASLQRLVKSGVLIRVVKGVYVFALSRHIGANTIEAIAKAMRRGEYSYVSLESALSEYGVISQIPIDRITIMTTGRKGEYQTPYGVIEFTHTERPLKEIINSMKSVGRPLRLATKLAAWRDLKRVGRNTHLVEEELLHE
ncbi:MAG: type IV toxin-antitoxin system AbiEi family antitoxin [Pseudohongiellaceae bacterium]